MSWIVQICCVFTCFTIHVPCTRTSGYFRECSCLEIHVLEHHDYLPFIMSQIHAYFADLLYFDWHFTSKWMTHTWSQAERITRANQRLMRTSKTDFLTDFFQLHLHTWFCAKPRSDSHKMFGGLKELMAPRMSLQTCISQITCNINTLTLCKSGKSLTHEE